jgi:hypothetical protein
MSREQLTVFRMQLTPSWSVDKGTQEGGFHACAVPTIRRAQRGRDAQYCPKFPTGLSTQSSICIKGRKYLRSGTSDENPAKSPRAAILSQFSDFRMLLQEGLVAYIIWR